MRGARPADASGLKSMSPRSVQPARRLPLIACSLDGDSIRTRLAEWAGLLRQATLREEMENGLRYRFPASDDLEREVRDLAAAEHACCSFLSFAVVRTADHLAMTVTASREGQEALRFIFLGLASA